MLRRFGCCWLKFDRFHTWANNTQHVATHRNTVAKRTQHVAPNNVRICCVGMLRSFGRGFNLQKKPLCFVMSSRHRRWRDNFSVARFFLKLVTLTKSETKKDTNARVAGRRKEIKESAAEQICIDNISSGLNGTSPTIPVIAFKFPNFYIFTFCSLSSILCPPYTTAIASCAWRIFASSLIDVFSFLLRCFRFFKLVHVFNLNTYNLIELHLIPNFLVVRTTMLNKWA